MENEKKTFTGMKENHIEGRNAVLEAFRSGKTIDINKKAFDVGYQL